MSTTPLQSVAYIFIGVVLAQGIAALLYRSPEMALSAVLSAILPVVIYLFVKPFNK